MVSIDALHFAADLTTAAWRPSGRAAEGGWSTAYQLGETHRLVASVAGSRAAGCRADGTDDGEGHVDVKAIADDLTDPAGRSRLPSRAALRWVSREAGWGS